MELSALFIIMSIPTKISYTELVTYVVAAVACWNSFSSPALVVTLSSQTRVQTSPRLVAWTWYSPETGQWWSTQQGNKVLDRIITIGLGQLCLSDQLGWDGQQSRLQINVLISTMDPVNLTGLPQRWGDNYHWSTLGLYSSLGVSIFQVIELLGCSILHSVKTCLALPCVLMKY